ncbi:Bystin-domain-containing protein [Boletus reticuloceps]|uniref:Bystin-domain-containing protein n=1 Tax=Boletus reticuloceps TaxID=495285 RepID=A0A8I2YSL8_9AGAM|nr:Bystin-domain-containing protein [Boletus reticuloceps]
MPRTQRPQKQRRDPLLTQLDGDELYAKYGRVSQPGKRSKSQRHSAEDDTDEVILDPKTSRKIFELARDQQGELEMPDDEDDEDDNGAAGSRNLQPQMRTTDDLSDQSDHDETEEMSDGSDAEAMFQLDSVDVQALDTLLPPNSGERRTLADVIFSKLENSKSGNVTVIRKVQQDKQHPNPALGLDPRLVESYSKLAIFLRGYKSGQLPKLFKVVPSLPAWARILALTKPEQWSPHACRAATRIFISTMKPPQAQLFLSVVLLDAIREDIQSHKKLDVQYYECLKRALYKPGAFFKGIVFPMLEGGCSLKEAAIIASVVAKKKVPVLHSAAALLRIAQMDYTGPNSLFIRVLVDKKYQLPYKVVDALVFHFIRLSNTYKARSRGDTEKLPVLWHQSLLAFCQRYSPDLTPDQKDALLDVVRVNPHPQIGPEVRRELVNSVARGEPRPDGVQDVDMS